PPRYVTWTMAVLLLVALLYTALGGMLSLMVTNYLQYVLLAAGTLIVTAACLSRIGWSGMTGAVVEHLHGRGLDPFADLGVGPAFILWQVLLWVAFMTVWQSAAMRAFSARDAAAAAGRRAAGGGDGPPRRGAGHELQAAARRGPAGGAAAARGPARDAGPGRALRAPRAARAGPP